MLEVGVMDLKAVTVFADTHTCVCTLTHVRACMLTLVCVHTCMHIHAHTTFLCFFSSNSYAPKPTQEPLVHLKS